MESEVEAGRASENRKTLVKDQLPKRFKALKFGIQSTQDILNQGVLEVSDNLLYDVENNRAPFKHGPLDPRLVSINTSFVILCPMS